MQGLNSRAVARELIDLAKVILGASREIIFSRDVDRNRMMDHIHSDIVIMCNFKAQRPPYKTSWAFFVLSGSPSPNNRHHKAVI